MRTKQVCIEQFLYQTIYCSHTDILYHLCFKVFLIQISYVCLTRGRSRGRVQGVCTPPPPPKMTCGFLVQLVFCQKKNYLVYWF